MLRVIRSSIVSRKQVSFSKSFHSAGVIFAPKKITAAVDASVDAAVDTHDVAHDSAEKSDSSVDGKAKLAAAIAEITGLTKKDINSVLIALPTSMTKMLADGKSVRLNGVGTFKTVIRASRVGYNIGSKKMESFPEYVGIKCVISRTLKDIVK